MTRRSTSDHGVGKQALERLRAETYELVEVTPSVAPEEFRSSASGMHLGNGIFFEGRFSAARLDRTPAHIARGGFDHYQLSMFLDGETEFAAGRRVTRMRPGDVVLIDVAQANRTDMAAGRSGSIHVVALALPRPLLAPLLGTPDSISATLLARDSPAGRLVGERLLALRRDGAELRTDDAAVAVNGVAALVAEAVGPAGHAGLAVARASRSALLAAIKAHIETHLLSETVVVPALCRRFRLSRATLYRLFESEGGLAHYIQERRLHRAFMQLISPAGRRMRIIDLAVDSHFSSDNTFIRAFRRRFGLTPGEARDLAAGRAPAAGGFGSDHPLAWIDGFTTS
jgi:AraC-like DNA-binding protein